ncbi:MAG: right-handed parallel beta-helix repeat-containing protein [Candidatus Bathyarchaeota archaeon]|nr:right-handed parallel beta-helix repeat-containing protein [Candidatus Bathyarchaeum sp.]
MNKQPIPTVLVSLVVFSFLFGLHFVIVVEANFLPVLTPQPAYVILSDGSVDPATAPIQRDGDSYKLTDNIVGYTIAVERDSIVLDGNGYTLQGNGNSTGVFIKGRNNVTVQNMKISGFTRGIYLFSDVFMEATGNNMLYANNITNNQWGIYIQHSTNNVIRNNQLNNTGSIFVTYSPLSDDMPSFINDIDTSNTVNGKPIIYWINQHDKTVPQDAGQVILVNCTNITVQNLDLTHNSHGVMLIYTNSSTVTQNSITNNEDNGVYVYKSSGNSITENTIEDNGDDGVHLWHSTDNTVTGNSLTANNQNGVYLFSSSQNSINTNDVKLNTQGIYVYSSSMNNNITRNTIIENIEDGVTVSWSSKTTISENNIERNGNGIQIDESSNNIIIGNVVKENIGWGIQLEDGQKDNIIYHNYFTDNNAEGMQVSIPGLWAPDTWDPGNPNVWDDGEKGNYWSDYATRYPNATEIGDTGIGDTQFYINPNNIDRYPIMDPQTIPEFPSEALVLFTLTILAVSSVAYRRKMCDKR